MKLNSKLTGQLKGKIENTVFAAMEINEETKCGFDINLFRYPETGARHIGQYWTSPHQPISLFVFLVLCPEHCVVFHRCSVSNKGT